MNQTDWLLNGAGWFALALVTVVFGGAAVASLGLFCWMLVLYLRAPARAE